MKELAVIVLAAIGGLFAAIVLRDDRWAADVRRATRTKDRGQSAWRSAWVAPSPSVTRDPSAGGASVEMRPWMHQLPSSTRTMDDVATTISLEAAGEMLAELVREWRSGEVEVLDVTVDVSEDRDGVPSVNLTAVLTDPSAGADTWPIENLLPLRREVRARANGMGLEAPVYLWFKPTSDPPQDDDT